MSRIIAVTSQKGGVGKTTTAVNLAASFSRLGHRVLIADCDPQGGAGAYGRVKSAAATGMLAAMRGECSPEDIIAPMYDDGRVAGCVIGMGHPSDLLDFETASAKGELGRLITSLAAGFDYILVDTPVGSSTILKAALEKADEMLLVLNCRAAAVKTLPDFVRLAQWIRSDINPALKLAGIAVTMYREGDSSEKKIFDHLRAHLPAGLFLESIIPFDPGLEMAGIRSAPAMMVSSAADSARAYLEMAAEIKKREGELDSGAALDLGDLVAEGMDGRDDDSGEDDEDRVNFRNRRAENILAEMCDRANLAGAVIADRTGLPLAVCGLEARTADIIAAMAPELGKTIEKATVYMDQPNANDISIDLGSGERIVLRAFAIDGVPFYLVGLCPRTADPAGEMLLAATRLTEELA